MFALRIAGWALVAVVAGCSSVSEENAERNGDPGGGVASAGGNALPVEQLGAKRPISDDPTSAPDTLFENTIFDATKNLAVWLPPGREVRGLLLLNGTPNAPNVDDIKQGKKWRGEQAQDVQLAARQLASLWDFGLVTGTTWTDENRSRFDDQVKLFEDALSAFEAKTGQRGLASLPVAIQGGSRFAGFGPTYAQKRPERVIAYVVEVAGTPVPTAASKGIPGLMIPGSSDGGAEKVTSGFYPARTAGASLAVAMNWRTGHECASCRDIAWPFFDHVIRARMREKGAPLAPPDEGAAWFGNTETWTFVQSATNYAGDRARASWLPDHFIANVWRNYTLEKPSAAFTSPTQPYKWGGGFAQKPSAARASDVFTLTATLTDAPTGDLTFYDGDVRLGVAERSADGKSASLANIRLVQGLHSFLVMSDTRPLSRPAGMLVLP